MICLQIYKELNVRIPRKTINSLFEIVYKNEISSKSKGRINLVFTHDERLKELNNQFRDINKSTDVLSFNIDEPDDKDAVFGEIYISIPTAKRQAVDYKAPLSEEIIRLCCHGFLHLLGYDHLDKIDTVIMKEKEEKYLQDIYA